MLVKFSIHCTEIKVTIYIVAFCLWKYDLITLKRKNQLHSTFLE